jgi:hypothetical protein
MSEICLALHCVYFSAYRNFGQLAFHTTQSQIFSKNNAFSSYSVCWIFDAHSLQHSIRLIRYMVIRPSLPIFCLSVKVFSGNNVPCEAVAEEWRPEVSRGAGGRKTTGGQEEAWPHTRQSSEDQQIKVTTQWSHLVCPRSNSDWCTTRVGGRERG